MKTSELLVFNSLLPHGIRKASPSLAIRVNRSGPNTQLRGFLARPPSAWAGRLEQLGRRVIGVVISRSRHLPRSISKSFEVSHPSLPILGSCDGSSFGPDPPECTGIPLIKP